MEGRTIKCKTVSREGKKRQQIIASLISEKKKKKNNRIPNSIHLFYLSEQKQILHQHNEG